MPFIISLVDFPSQGGARVPADGVESAGVRFLAGFDFCDEARECERAPSPVLGHWVLKHSYLVLLGGVWTTGIGKERITEGPRYTDRQRERGRDQRDEGLLRGVSLLG